MADEREQQQIEPEDGAPRKREQLPSDGILFGEWVPLTAAGRVALREIVSKIADHAFMPHRDPSVRRAQSGRSHAVREPQPPEVLK